MKLTGRRSREPAWLAAAAGALMVGGPVWHYLATNHYPFARPEAVALPVAGALVGAALALVAWRAGGWLGTLFFATALFLFVDLQTDLHEHARTFILFAACVALSQLLWARRAMLVCITLGAFYLAGLPRIVAGIASEQRLGASSQPSSLPLIIHLILDEQWGIGGFRAVGDSTTADFLEEFYTERGFEVYPAAYSRWSQTKTSVPDILYLGQPLAVDSIAAKKNYRPRANPYFARLRERGYRIRVHQSTYMDYCHTPGAEIEACDEVPANSIANFAYFRGSWTHRALLAGRYFLNVTSRVYAKLRGDRVVWRRSVAGGGLRQLASLRDQVASRSRKGTAYFVHALLPHRPTDVDAECRAHTAASKRIGYEDLVLLSDSAYRAHLELYAAQSRCAHRALGEVLAAVDRMVGRDGSIIIVHGDHGSRMSQDGQVDLQIAGFDERHLNAAFSTLLAIRRPGVPAAVHAEPVPVQDFLWHLIGSDFTGSNPGDWRHFVHARPSGTATEDTVRELGIQDMVWARAGAAKTNPLSVRSVRQY